MRNLDLDALAIFKAVAEEGTVTRAAARLHRVQSNVTTRVKQLEEQLGTPLFLRHTRGFTLTSEGRLLLGYAERMLQLSSEAQAALRDGTPRGSFQLGTLESTAATRLPPLLSRFHLKYPDVHIELVTGTSGALVSRILGHQLEAAFVAEPFAREGLEHQHAFNEELVLITPKSFPPIKTARDIGSSSVIAFPTGCSYRKRLESWLSRAQLAPDRVSEFASYHAILACVAAGAGIAVVTRALMQTVDNHEIKVYSLPASIARTRTMLVWRRGHRSITLEAFQRDIAGLQRSRSHKPE
jgi:DNA-binding transcriptional LysR family regulator